MAIESSLRIRLVVFAAAITLVVAAMIESMPPTHATMEVGPVGGSFYQIGLEYQKFLARKGITLELRSKDNSLEIIDDVKREGSGIDIGLEAQDVSGYRESPVFTAGHIQLQPLFIFASADLGRRISITDLRGRKIVMPAITSATSDAAVRMFQLYDITRENTSFTFMPLTEGAEALRAGRFDAGAFMLAPDNALMRKLASYTGLRLVPLGTVKAITNHLQFLQSVVLPRGIYDIADGIPAADVPMVAGTVDVVIRAGLHPYVIYLLLEAMAEVHRGPTFLSNAGDYPSISGASLTVDPVVQQYYRTGMPWTYRNLPPFLASFVSRYLLLAVVAFVLMELFRLSGYLASCCSLLNAMRGRWRFRERRRRSIPARSTQACVSGRSAAASPIPQPVSES
jgi:TRAP-type uncharacterized transport system substrate-binding protein